jgi:zinc transport system permease protein
MLIAAMTGFLELDPIFQLYLNAYCAIALTCAITGILGTFIVGNRLAFFSDALAHCAFTGIALGLLLALLQQGLSEQAIDDRFVPIVMMIAGVCFAVGIVYVREQTALPSDTIIAVFFAGAIGFGVMLLAGLRRFTSIDPDQYLFGNPLFVNAVDLIALGCLICILLVGLRWFNPFLLSSFSTSLARSRQINTHLLQYLFVILIALAVNISIRAVGVLLINAMLLVPAATAANLARNIRQFFWLTLGISLTTGLLGLWLSDHLAIPVANSRQPLQFGPSGLIVVFSVILFFLSTIYRQIMRQAYRTD